MTIVESVVSAPLLKSDWQSYQRDTITLSWEDRRRGHGRRTSDLGFEFAISLPQGTILKEGDGFVLNPDQRLVVVHEALEPVYVVRPETPQQWAYFAYQAGNRHQPVMIAQSELIFPQNAAVRSLFDQLGIPCTTAVRPFRAAMVNSGHADDAGNGR